MTGAAIHQRCWNHDTREAVCRCPECGRTYCRECVSEHESRLLCAACLAAASRLARPKGARMRKLLPAAMALGGVLFAWIFFYTAGEGLIVFSQRMEQSLWQNR